MTDIQHLILAEDDFSDTWLGIRKNTLRIGDKHESLAPGPAVFVSKDGEQEAPVTITGITRKRFGEIDAADAAAQGGRLENLKHELKDIHYKHLAITDETPVFVVSFDPPPVTKDLRRIFNKICDGLAAEGNQYPEFWHRPIGTFFWPVKGHPGLDRLLFQSRNYRAIENLSHVFEKSFGMSRGGFLPKPTSYDTWAFWVVGYMDIIASDMEKTIPARAKDPVTAPVQKKTNTLKNGG